MPVLYGPGMFLFVLFFVIVQLIVYLLTFYVLTHAEQPVTPELQSSSHEGSGSAV